MNKNAITDIQARELQNDYIVELDKNPQYSLEVDPEGKYSMSEKQKRFVKNFCEFKDIALAARMSGINMTTAQNYYVAYSSQQEIRRINKAMYQRQFASRLLSLDEVGGYLTSLLTDFNVAQGEQLKPADKLKVAQMIIDLNKFKISSFQQPSNLMQTDIESQIKDLSVSTLQELLNQERKKHAVDVDVINDNMSPEESAYLSTLPTEELLKMIEQAKGGNNDK